MTKKDYILLAEAFRESKPPLYAADAVMSQWTLDVEYIVTCLGRDNPRFSPTKFWEACLAD